MERHEAEYFAQVPKDDLRIDLVRALESLPDMYRAVPPLCAGELQR